MQTPIPPGSPLIFQNGEESLEEILTLALRALAWTLEGPERARRMLDVTGLDAGDLRARAGDPALLAAVIMFLEAHEPDLVACAEALEVKPEALVAARRILER